jgi:hypothetical protein
MVRLGQILYLEVLLQQVVVMARLILTLAVLLALTVALVVLEAARLHGMQAAQQQVALAFLVKVMLVVILLLPVVADTVLEVVGAQELLALMG